MLHLIEKTPVRVDIAVARTFVSYKAIIWKYVDIGRGRLSVSVKETCPICGTEVEVSERSWFYTCVGCGSGINMIGIWWHGKTGEHWTGLPEEAKRRAGDEFYARKKDEVDWSNVVIEI